MPKLNVDAIELIEQLGGNAKAASLCEVSPAAVSQWRHNGIPKAQLKFLRVARPDIFTAVYSRTTDPLPAPGHAGRQPPSPTNILDTVPTHSVVLPAIPPSLDPKEKP